MWPPIWRLPLYEGVDWNCLPDWLLQRANWSPSLRGSGLKFLQKVWNCFTVYTVSLFTREWIEIEPLSVSAASQPSPSLRGSGLKYKHLVNYQNSRMSPSLRGSGLKSVLAYAMIITDKVSLFTREWIEIAFFRVPLVVARSPSLRGSGLKSSGQTTPASRTGLPLYEGVDWNAAEEPPKPFLGSVSLFTREWIEIT